MHPQNFPSARIVDLSTSSLLFRFGSILCFFRRRILKHLRFEECNAHPIYPRLRFERFYAFTMSLFTHKKHDFHSVFGTVFVFS